jgi:hypothetical protein
MELIAQVFIIVKGYIDAKDDRGVTLHGTVLAVVSRRETMYLSVMFSRDESVKSMEWSSLLFVHREKDAEPDRDPTIIHHEEELKKYLERGMVLNSIARNRISKQAEQAISRFCLESLQLKTVTFIEYFDASESDLELFKPDVEPAAAPPDDAAASGGETKADAPESLPGANAERDKGEIFVRCDPILDPVAGVAMNEIATGDLVLGRLPADSVFFKLLSRNIPGFDGVITASVTGVLQNDLGTSTLTLNLSDGISGIMKLRGKVKIKVASRPRDEGAADGPAGEGFLRSLPPELVFTAAAAVILAASVGLIYYVIR